MRIVMQAAIRARAFMGGIGVMPQSGIRKGFTCATCTHLKIGSYGVRYSAWDFSARERAGTVSSVFYYGTSSRSE